MYLFLRSMLCRNRALSVILTRVECAVIDNLFGLCGLLHAAIRFFSKLVHMSNYTVGDCCFDSPGLGRCTERSLVTADRLRNSIHGGPTDVSQANF